MKCHVIIRRSFCYLIAAANIVLIFLIGACASKGGYHGLKTEMRSLYSGSPRDVTELAIVVGSGGAYIDNVKGANAEVGLKRKIHMRQTCCKWVFLLPGEYDAIVGYCEEGWSSGKDVSMGTFKVPLMCKKGMVSVLSG